MVEARTLAKKTFFLGGGGGGNLKNDGFIFPHIQSRSKPYTDDVLRYLNITGPSKNSCIG